MLKKCRNCQVLFEGSGWKRNCPACGHLHLEEEMTEQYDNASDVATAIAVAEAIDTAITEAAPIPVVETGSEIPLFQGGESGGAGAGGSFGEDSPADTPQTLGDA